MGATVGFAAIDLARDKRIVPPHHERAYTSTERQAPTEGHSSTRPRSCRRSMADSTSETVRHIEANGLRFALIEQGEGPLVLLCHGFPDTARTWDALRPRLAKAGYRAVSPYMRGYAPTEAPTDPPDARTLGRDLLAWMDALGAETACVVGHDWGALATYAAMAMDPERIDHAIVVDVPHPMTTKTPTLRLAWHVRHFLLFNLPWGAAWLRRNDFAYLETLFQRWSPTWRYTDDDLADIRASLSPPGAAEAAAAYYHMARDPKSYAMFEEPLRVPTTAVAGLDHPVLTPAMFEAAAPWHDAPFEVVALPGGHFLHREHPNAFADMVLSRLPPPR